MTSWIVAGCLLPPLILVAMMAFPRLRVLARKLAPWSGFPALFFSLLPEAGSSVKVPWLLLEASFEIDLVARVFLGLTALLWTSAGFFASHYFNSRSDVERYFVFHLLAMTGNLGLVVSQDLAGFYFFFALMSFSSYGLILHGRTPNARFAGRAYILLAVFGEMLILTGLWLASHAAQSLVISDVAAAVGQSPYADLIIGCLLFGFGVKAGLFPLHLWLPLAHPAAPVPGSAVLSGIMIKAGVLGWMRFLPLGHVDEPVWGGICIVLGLIMIFGGVIVGTAQEEPKTVLAYSSISQMGFMTITIGAALAAHEAWPLALTALLVFTVHHAFAKGALFMGIGIVSKSSGRVRRLSLLAMAVSALALAGAPLSSGSIAKNAFKEAIHLVPGGWPTWIDFLLPLTGVGTTLLMGRFLYLLSPVKSQAIVAREDERAGALKRGLWGPWGVLLVGVFTALWFAPLLYGADLDGFVVVPLSDLFYATWPLLLGIALVWRVRWLRRHPQPEPMIPPGDLLFVFIHMGAWVHSRFRVIQEIRLLDWQSSFLRLRNAVWRRHGISDQVESRLQAWPVAGSLLFIVVTLIWLTLWGA